MAFVLDPVESCIIIPYKKGVEGEDESAFTLFVGEKVTDYTSPEFGVPRANIRLKLHVQKKEDGIPKIQFLLMRPENDIIEVTINEKVVILTGGSNSYVHESKHKPSTWKHGSGTGDVFRYKFRISGNPPFVPQFAEYLLHQNGTQNMRIILNHKQSFHVDKDLMSCVKGLAGAMKMDSTYYITDLTYMQMQAMIKFAYTGYCDHWYKDYDKLLQMAEKYEITGMKELAAEKKQLMDRLSASESASGVAGN